ncbi:MAG: DUF512 domain-containing protein [Oscillospiraceae bacterium]|nr:DUF512 domain-containing protein [Oscillospiraceae bacterium]
MRITAVRGAARRAGVRAGDQLLTINGHIISDMLDYRFYSADTRLTLRLRDPNGVVRLCRVAGELVGELGLEFDRGWIDSLRVCCNKCIFCFIDQNPPECRKSMCVKDDDARMSFLLGNYISMTNLSEDEVRRLCEMKFSPLGISIHTTDPELRVKMLGNPQAGASLGLLHRFADAGITMNGQIVLCPGINDGEALEKTLRDLAELGEAMHSVSIVPVGITKHRQGLYPLSPVSPQLARRIIETADKFPGVYPSDEIYLKAGLPIPPAEYYHDFPQLENGVGMLAMFEQEWSTLPILPPLPKQTIATGTAAAGFLKRLLGDSGVLVREIVNNFFGESVDIAGLLTGSDLIRGLEGKDLGGRVLIPQVMLKAQENVFLDDMTLPELEKALGVPVIAVPANANSLHKELWNH